MKNPVIAILASGEGTTAETFIRAGAEGKIKTKVGLIISNNQKAGIFERVKRLNQQYGLNIKSLYISKHTHPAKDEKIELGQQTHAEEDAILKALENSDIDLVALMGYMKRIGPNLVSRFGWRSEYISPYQAMMLNTHPGLLPETKGLYGIYVQQHVIDKKLPHGGQTLHVVSEDYDDGPIITEHQVSVLKNDTPGSLFDRVKEVEKKYLPSDVETFIEQRIKYLEGEK